MDEAANICSRPPNRLLTVFVFGGLALSLAALAVEVAWKSMNRYEQSGAIATSVGRKQLVWDLRKTRAASALGTPPAILSPASGDAMWSWSGPYDVHILLPDGRELKTDTLNITADIENGQITYLHMNGGTELTPEQARDKLLAEVKSMRPNRRMDGADGEEGVLRWYQKQGRGSTLIWTVYSTAPRVNAHIRDLFGGKYIVQYELSW